MSRDIAPTDNDFACWQDRRPRSARRRDEALIARSVTAGYRLRAAALTDAQLDCNIRTYPDAAVYARWRAACVTERAARPAGPWPLSAVEQRIRARAACKP